MRLGSLSPVNPSKGTQIVLDYLRGLNFQTGPQPEDVDNRITSSPDQSR